MRPSLTRRQSKILDFIIQMIEENGYPPTLREIGEEFSISSTRGVRDHLAALARKGYLKRNPLISRGIEVLQYTEKKIPPRDLFTRPLLGEIAAGKPVLAVENIEGTITLDKFLVRGQNSFALKVKGESMKDAGILEGDYVIVKQQPTADNRDIVVALLDEEATVKRFYREKKRVRLESANPHYPPIFPEKDFKILGKVIGVFRVL